jgi:hypothetical protein
METTGITGEPLSLSRARLWVYDGAGEVPMDQPAALPEPSNVLKLEGAQFAYRFALSSRHSTTFDGATLT